MPVTGDRQIAYRGLLLGPAPYIIRPPVEGLAGLPELRTSDRTRLRRHGLLPGDDFAAGRTITLDVAVQIGGSAAFQAAMDALTQAFTLTESGGALEPLTVQMPGVAGGGVCRMLARVRKVALPVDELWNPVDLPEAYAIASIMLDCPDPRIYDDTLSSVATTLPTAGGGLTFNATFNLLFGAVSTGGSIFAANLGTFPTPPTYRIDGPCTNPSIENVTSGQRLELTITLGSGEFLDIDTDARTVLLGGTASRYSTLTRADWFDLPPGTTELKFRAVTGTSAQLTATWRSAWL